MIFIKGDNRIKRKRGAPRKVFTLEDAPRRLETQIKTWIYGLFPAGRPINEVLEELLTVAYANKDEKDLSLLKKKAAELEYELSKVKVEIHNKEQAIQHQEEVQRSIIMQRKYMASVLRRIIKTSFSSRKVTTKPEWIEKLYGMSFDIPSLDTLLADTSKSIEQLYEISEMDLIEIVSARKISKGQKEPEIMQEILANEESDKK